MLAPEDDARSMDAVRFSLASDIVELVVLTDDELFLQTLREAVGASRRLWHVPSADKVGDLLLAGGVGILVLDANALREPCASFVTQMKHQFPDLVLVVAGTRDAETGLARLISNGSVYRFIHKPMSPGRARLFADAAVKRLEQQRRRSGTTAAAAAKPAPRGGLMIAGGCAAIGAIAVGIWALTHTNRQSAASPARDATAVEAERPAPASTPRAPAPNSESGSSTRPAQALAANRAGADGGRSAAPIDELAKARGPARKTPMAAAGASSAPDPAQAATVAPALEEPVRAAAVANAASNTVSGGGAPGLTAPAAAAPVSATVALASAAAAPAAALDPPALDLANAAPTAPSANDANDAVDASRLVLVKSVPPDYPREARQSSIEGWVELEFTVAASGRVKDLSVRAANPRGVFDQAARNALSQWRYQPVLVDSKPVPQRARIRIRFALAR